MTEIYNLFRGIVVVIFIGICVWGVAQIIPQAQSAATLPARVEAENARVLQEAQAAPTFVALSALGTRTAIENESIAAQANANAQTIQAQGIADGQRAQANALNNAVTGLIGLVAFISVLVVVVIGVRSMMASRATNNAVREVSQRGGTLQLPDNSVVSFEPRGAPKQIAAPRQEKNVIPTETKQHTGKRR